MQCKKHCFKLCFRNICGFCDRDDILHPKAIEILYDKLKNGLFDALKYSYKNEVIYKNKVQKEYTIKCDNLELSSIDLKKTIRHLISLFIPYGMELIS